MSILGVHPWEFLVIAIVMLVVVGPDQIPGVARKMGSAFTKARKMSEGLRDEFMTSMSDTEQALSLDVKENRSQTQIPQLDEASSVDEEPLITQDEDAEPEEPKKDELP